MQAMSITGDKNIKNITIDSPAHVFKEHYKFFVPRGPEPLKFHFQADSVEKNVTINARNSFQYYMNAWPSLAWGWGFFKDRHNPKRYAYQKSIYLSGKNNTVKVTRFEPAEKGRINLTISLPHINSFYVKTLNSSRNSAGFWGIETGIDYYYKDNGYISVYGGIATDFFVPVPAPVDYSGELQSSSTKFISIRNNHTLGRMDIGYGLQLSQLRWHISNSADSAFIPKTNQSTGLGLSVNASYRRGNSFRIGLLYQPNFISFNTAPSTGYQHFVSIEFMWKLPLRNPR